MTTYFFYGMLLVLMLPMGTVQAQVGVLAVGSNRSADPSLKPLRYAAQDARRFANTMRTVGMLSEGDVSVYENPSLASFRKAIKTIKAKWLKPQASQSQKFVFYYSGHADARGLHLADGIVTKEELHRSLEGIKAKTKVVFLDSCYAGGLAQKGIREVKPFKIPRATYDEPTGSIFLSATSDNRLAYESKELGGSLFSHHLIRGLEGSADGNRDGVVTVTELYEYSFQQAQFQNQVLPAFAQKPEFISDLKGRGAVALSFPLSQVGTLSLMGNLFGEVLVRSRRGLHSFQFNISHEKSRSFKLAAGEYQVRVNHDNRVGITEAKIHTNKTTVLTTYDFDWIEQGTTRFPLPVNQKGLAIVEDSSKGGSHLGSVAIGVSFLRTKAKSADFLPTVAFDVILKPMADVYQLSAFASTGNKDEAHFTWGGGKLDRIWSPASLHQLRFGLNFGYGQMRFHEDAPSVYFYRPPHQVKAEALSFGGQANYHYSFRRDVAFHLEGLLGSFLDGDESSVFSLLGGMAYAF